MRRILRTREAAQYLGIPESTLEKQRLKGGGPHFIRLGARAVGYDIADLDAWLEDRRCVNAREVQRQLEPREEVAQRAQRGDQGR